ncbi:cell division protein FtsQ/DivIB [Streptomyces zhihengii]|uniref:Cell division protein FtsQ n=1 Tax=Streptomyces zhihengii TaxID=1818004 RepID=A0ABS2UXM5_9ACTN|nr:FtsQ-type POTRA domain-containing protein [Streptomyces zhihengii]MBM9622109.1 FtsQ-type POTRA domain-containing protein [Streptomyces zhihengii]
MAGPTTAERGADTPPDGSTGPAGPSGPSGQDPAVRRRLLVRRALIGLAAAALLAAGLLWVLYGSSWLRTEEVRATGTGVLTARQVEEVAAVPVGEPMVSVDTDAVEARLLAGLPRIASVEAVRSWPGTIELKVTERVPVLLLEKGARFAEVDAEGVQFATVDKAPRGVPLVRLDLAGSPGAARFTAGRLLAEAVTVRGDLPARVVRETTALEVRSYDDISLRLTGDRRVLWGSSEHGAAKARTLGALMKASPGARQFDVSAPTAPAVAGS